MVKDKSGNTHTNKDEVLKCWQEHFEAHLNTKFPHEPEAMLDIPPPPPDAETQGEITTEEIKKAIARMVAMLHKIFNTVYDTEKTPKDWAKMMVTPIHKKGDKQTPANYLSIPGKVVSRVR